MSERKKIIITGGAGFIGSHTVVELYQAGYEPIIIDNFYNSNPIVLSGLQNILKKEVKTYKVDCNDYQGLKNVFLKEKNVAGVIHFAAFKNVAESVSFPLKYYSNNIGALLNLLQIMIEEKVSNLIFSSTCAIYGEPDVLPVPENTEINSAKSPYGNTKKICENILSDLIAAKSKIKIISLRYFNPIGAHPSAEIGEYSRDTPGNIVPVITQVAIGKRKNLNVYGSDYTTSDGTCMRDFIHVLDLASAHVKAFEFIEKITSDSYYNFFNIGTGKGATVMQLIHTFEKISGIKLKYDMATRRPGDIEKIYANVEKAERLLKWKATRSLEESLLDAWNWERKTSIL